MGGHVEDSQVLQELRAMGVRLSIDDFGTGYSSLSYLKRFPVDTLKIDRTFIRDISSDVDDRALCQAIIGLAHTLNVVVVAEGVETEEQLVYLRQWRCDLVQGCFFSEPLSPERFEAFVLSEERRPRLSMGGGSKAG